MTSQTPVQCFACQRRLTKVDPNTDTPLAETCTAYPDGIPDEIGMLGADHRVPFGGEKGGLLFLRAEGVDADDAWHWWQLFDSAKNKVGEKKEK
jgi:hypothetical protein